MYTTAACPSPKVLGTVNGYAQMVISFTRALGPAGATTLFALSVENNWAGGYAVFWFFMALALVALWCTRFLPKEPSPIR
jgi:MFS family permease